METSEPISSAVHLHESKDRPPLTTSPPQKRQRSTSSSPSAKRTRLSKESSAGSPSTVRASPPHVSPDAEQAPASKEPSTDHSKSNVQEERKRGKRLFGGLLSTLSQTSSTTQQKKRLEIQKRQQERAREREAEEELKRKDKSVKLAEVRRKAQVKFDQQSMHIRHANLLATAHFLSTKTQPKLYYKPWELLPEDKKRIEAQIADTEALISREEEAFKLRYNDSLDEERPAEVSKDEETVSEHQVVSESVSAVFTDSTNPPSLPNAKSSFRGPAEVEKDLVDDGVMIKGDEDMVIY